MFRSSGLQGGGDARPLYMQEPGFSKALRWTVDSLFPVPNCNFSCVAEKMVNALCLRGEAGLERLARATKLLGA
jgi:hypothetical protein